MERKTKIIILWVLIITGFLTHSLTDIMPAFWGESIAAMQPPASVGMITFMMFLTYTFPVIGILLTIYGNKTTIKINIVLACIMAVFTTFHLSELFMEFNFTQLFILPLMAAFAILLTKESLKLNKE
ncbi:MAG: hypothetical protein IJ150_08875 [Bacteroidales bacterium]|nr:hypothetical protein [Bacteroidales bacterium]